MEKAKLTTQQAEIGARRASEDNAAEIRALEELELGLAAGGGDGVVDWGG